MGRKVQLNYDELGTFVKKFRDEGEDIVQMHSKMRDRVHDLRKDWVGESADKFFNEMENDVLPALVRLSNAIFYAQDVLQKIIKTIRAFDEDTVRFFGVDFAHIGPLNLGAFLAGAGMGAGIGGLVDGALPGGNPGADGAGIGGAGQPIQADSQAGLGQTGSGDQTPGAGGQLAGAGGGTGSGIGTGSGEALGSSGVGSGAATGAGGQFSQGGSSGIGSIGPAGGMQDHVYEGHSAGGAAVGVGSASGATSGGATGDAGSGVNTGANVGAAVAGAGAAAGLGAALGGAGAAAAGAGKILKGRFRKKKK